MVHAFPSSERNVVDWAIVENSSLDSSARKEDPLGALVRHADLDPLVGDRELCVQRERRASVEATVLVTASTLAVGARKERQDIAGVIESCHEPLERLVVEVLGRFVHLRPHDEIAPAEPEPPPTIRVVHELEDDVPRAKEHESRVRGHVHDAPLAPSEAAPELHFRERDLDADEPESPFAPPELLPLARDVDFFVLPGADGPPVRGLPGENRLIDEISEPPASLSEPPERLNVQVLDDDARDVEVHLFPSPSE